MRAEHCAGVELGSFTSFSVCMFKLQFVFVRSGTGGGEEELSSVLLSVRWLSPCTLNTAFLNLVFECFKLF